METQVVALVKPEHNVEIYNRIMSMKLKRNYHFMPDYHVTDLLDEYSHDMFEFTKQVLTTCWGMYSPRDGDGLFIQPIRVHGDDGYDLQVVLIRNSKEQKRIYVHEERSPRYGNRTTAAYVSCYMCDMDDDGEFYSDDIDNNLLQYQERYDDRVWKKMY